MEVKPGYKQTEVGVLPEEWEVKRLGDVATFYKGKGLPKSALSESGAEPCIHYGELFTRYLETIREIYSRTRTSEGVFRSVANDVLMPTSDVTPRGLAKASCVRVDGVILGGDILVIRSETHRVHGPFLSLVIRYEETQVLQLVTGSTVYHLYRSDMKNFTFSMPPLPEQRAIATALSDVDGLLGGLDRLIAKKRDLKQAAMQQLLTGQTRLPGFHAEWEVKRLKLVAEISTGINKPLSEMGSGTLYVTVQDLYDKISIRTERLSRIKVSPSEIETRGLTVGDIVFGKSSVKRDGIGYPSQFLGCDEPVVFSGFTYRARARSGITDATFLFYALREEKTRRWLIDNSQASALTNINQTIADAIPVNVPPNVPEQTAIAAVLTEMDAELAALEQRREKTRALKQAMMQELLTGRTRLV